MTLQVSKEVIQDRPSRGLSLFSQECLLPAAAISNCDDNDGPIAKDKLLFCYHAVLRAIDSCLAGIYTDFDGHTTTNCCHGMALLACRLIQEVRQFDLISLRQEGEQKIQLLEQNATSSVEPCTWWIPEALVNLACLYVLGSIKESDPLKGGRTSTKKLKEISPISTNACNMIAHDLQKRFSNEIAMRYESYLNALDMSMQINGAPVAMWGKYVSPQYLRTDKRGLVYASNLFSLEVSLAYLISTKAIVALINDIKDTSGNLKERYTCLFKGDGQGQLRMLSADEIQELSFFSQEEPVVVLGGCAYSDTLDKEAISLQMQAWHDRIPGLILACDVFYPQFFKVLDDPEFDSSPIVPEEERLQDILNGYVNVKGVSSSDPSLYCATHIFPASFAQVIQVWSGKNEKALPISFIPGNKINTL